MREFASRRVEECTATPCVSEVLRFSMKATSCFPKETVVIPLSQNRTCFLRNLGRDATEEQMFCGESSRGERGCQGFSQNSARTKIYSQILKNLRIDFRGA